jgi:hypothetical protein
MTRHCQNDCFLLFELLVRTGAYLIKDWTAGWPLAAGRERARAIQKENTHSSSIAGEYYNKLREREREKRFVWRIIIQARQTGTCDESQEQPSTTHGTRTEKQVFFLPTFSMSVESFFFFVAKRKE